ncbi:MAG: 23S rRNA (uracil(1939)-C(5))-methyltransferase RlmD [Parachlamydiaceae bacterium]|nr:23S rRNA (uracil(1939)-C(5))-methyltransferase RlmD [Parachlamydiaceae bacterium]
MKNKQLQVHDLHITALNAKGNGMGIIERPNALPAKVEVPFARPGDVVQARLLRKRAGCFSAILEEVTTPSPQRIAAKCVHFGVCGGCRFQHTSYEEQLQNKENFVRHCFSAILSDSVRFEKIVPSPSPWHYRNKMEYSFSSDAAGKKYLGLVMDSSRGKVFNLQECFLTHHWFVDVVKAVSHWWHESGLQSYHMRHNSGSLRTLTVREGQRTGDRLVMLTVSGNPDFALKKQHLESFVAFVRDIAEPTAPDSQLSIFLRIQQTGKGMTTQMYEMLLHGPDHIREILHIDTGEGEKVPVYFGVSPSAFFQPNTQQAEQLYSVALKFAQIESGAVVYDLYCGTGALGLCVAKRVKQVIGIEISPEASLDARTNATLNGCDNVTIYTGSVRDVLKEFPGKGIPAPDVVMVDPPRAGLDAEAIQLLIELSPQKIIYVSCNPVTQALNVEELLKHGYRLMAIQPVDQFPQTYHVENVVLLHKEIDQK